VEAHTVSVDERLPMTLTHMHREVAVGSSLALQADRGGCEAERVDRLADVVVGAGFDVDELQVDEPWIRVRARRARTLSDTVGPGMRLLVCGLNPSVYAADFGVGYARPGNRFWPAAQPPDRRLRASPARPAGHGRVASRGRRSPGRA